MVGCHHCLDGLEFVNQIPYDYTVEVRNRFKELDLIHRVSDELWTEVHDIVQKNGNHTILDTWGWCTWTTHREGMGREEGSGWGTYTCGGFISIFGKTNTIL